MNAGKDLSQTIIRFLESHGSLHLLPEVIGELNEYYDRHVRKANVAVVTTSAALSDEEQQALRSELQDLFGRELDLQMVLDDSVLGGVKIQVGDVVIDRTLQSRLQEIRSVLLK